MAEEDLVENLVSLIRVAKQESKQSFVDYSARSIQRIKEMSNLALALSQDVDNNMENFRIVVQPVVSAGDGRAIGEKCCCGGPLEERMFRRESLSRSWRKMD